MDSGFFPELDPGIAEAFDFFVKHGLGYFMPDDLFCVFAAEGPEVEDRRGNITLPEQESFLEFAHHQEVDTRSLQMLSHLYQAMSVGVRFDHSHDLHSGRFFDLAEVPGHVVQVELDPWVRGEV